MKTHLPSVVMAGLESAGKSALFRGLTGHASGDEANFRGSTVTCRRCRLPGCQCDLVDTPGIRVSSDTHTTLTAMQATQGADAVLLVARGTHVVSEVETLLRELDLQHKKSALVITFKDKAPGQIELLAQTYRERLGIPVVVVNARRLTPDGREDILDAIAAATAIRPKDTESGRPEITLPAIQPKLTWLEHRRRGPWLALACMAAMFAVPVYAAYAFASWAQPCAEAAFLSPLKEGLAGLPDWAEITLTGSYGLLTLGWYSFLWAFPVVLLNGVSVALAEETGLKDRISAALDPWLRSIGLTGRDLIPVLTGFGCNVVAVFQSRSCSSCTRKSCVSLISFGSACSYQIGASLSLFGSAGQPWLFFPYLAGLFLVGALHTRLWHGRMAAGDSMPLHERAFLQAPSARAVAWRVRTLLKQFLKQAMPLFLLICLVASVLDQAGCITWLAGKAAPLLQALHLPGETAPGILFSIIRKDGLLALNSGQGTLLATLSTGQIFILVWLASTFSACAVTLATLGRELGWGQALQAATRQATTSLASTFVFSLFIRS